MNDEKSPELSSEGLYEAKFPDVLFANLEHDNWIFFSLSTWLFGTIKTIPEAQKWDGQAPSLLFFLLQKTLWVDFSII